MTTSEAKPGTEPPRSKTKPKRPWRDNLEAFAVAILMAVLLKPMLIEAYQIPTPSMQPTLMGSPEAGVYDRILVDKLRPVLFDPERWDLAVFRYPIRKNQNYVKRIVGEPGDRLRIAGGNLYEVGNDNKIAAVHRKPDHIQKGLWKEVYPARRYLVDEPGPIMGSYFEEIAGKWKEEGEDLIATPTQSGRTRLAFRDRDHSGLSNQIYDGYPTSTARAIRDAKSGGFRHVQGVQDTRFGFTITPEKSPSLLRVELRLRPPSQPEDCTMRLDVRDGKARLYILVGGEEKATTEAVTCAVPAGAASEIGFAHIDDRLLAWHDGDQILELEVGDLRVTDVLDPGLIVLGIECEGGGEQRYSDVRIARDLHYLPDGLEDALDVVVPEGLPDVVANHVIEVPEGHYFMMGDNTLASADSRQWRVLTVGRSADGRLVDPKTDPGAIVMQGNRRPWNLEVEPDNDENPVILRPGPGHPEGRVVFTDDNGEVFALKGEISPNYNEQHMEFVDAGGTNGSHRWIPEQKHVFFVPREHILGRPLMTFWPPSRIGFIR